MSSEISDIDDLPGYAVKLCTSQLYKIGKGQNPSGLLAVGRSPKCMRALSGGNDQIQTPVQLTGDCQGQRQCNGYELQRCINLLRGLHSFGLPGLDHTHGTGHTSIHCGSTQ